MRVGKGNVRATSNRRLSTHRPVAYGASRTMRALLAIFLHALVLALPTSASAVTTVTTGTTVTDTYSYTGNTETLTVPANVYQLTLTVTGAEGGQGGRDSAGT